MFVSLYLFDYRKQKANLYLHTNLIYQKNKF